MKKVSLLFMFLLQLAVAQPPSFKFTPDQGIRIDNVSIAHATFVNDTVFLFYNYQLFDGTHAKGVAIATKDSDWLIFDTTYSFNDFNYLFIRYRMPDSSYRKFEPDPATGRLLFSKSSYDGRYFNPDTGIRYTLQPTDSALGVRTFISAKDGSVHLFYNTINQQQFSCRHAISYPGNNGMQFHYINRNVFGDSAATSGHYFVDPNAIFNPDGSISIFLMNQNGGPFPPAARTGYIYTFTSTDNGQTFYIDKGTNGDSIRFKFDDYDSIYGFNDTVYSLNDPKAVILPDGRYRVYVTAMLKDSSGNIRYAIVSATSKLQNSVKSIDYGKYISIYPNPSNGRFSIKNEYNKELTFIVRDIEGKKLTQGKIRSEKSLNLSKYQSGAYIVEFILDGHIIFAEKIFIVK